MTLLWLDLETTGLSPTDDFILEVAWVITDSSLQYTGKAAVHSSLVDCGGVEFGRLHHDSSPYVREMHERSGLLADLTDPLTYHYSLEEIGTEISNDLELYATPDEPVFLAGASVHFDLGFLRQHMPELASRLSHRVYDTSTLKAFFTDLQIEHPVVNEGQHRAANDVRETLAVARFYRSYVFALKRSYETMLNEGVSL